MSDKTEKRKSSRVSFGKPVEIYPVFPSYSEYVDGSGKLPLEGMARDISDGGLGLTTSKPLMVGSFLKLCFQPFGDQKVEAYGRITWSKENFCGVMFQP